MRTSSSRYSGWWLVAAAGALLVALAGCDPTIKATVEDGAITVSQSLFGAFLRAFIELAGEQSSTTAALLWKDLPTQFFA